MKFFDNSTRFHGEGWGQAVGALTPAPAHKKQTTGHAEHDTCHRVPLMRCCSMLCFVRFGWFWWPVVIFVAGWLSGLSQSSCEH